MFSWSSRGRVVCAIFDANSKGDLSVKDQKVTNVDGVEPFGGKSGSVSFVGLTHQMVEEGKLVSAPFQESRSLLWVVAPIALISSVLIPQFFGILSTDLIQDVVLTGMGHAFLVLLVFASRLAVLQRTD
ncbi:hypothetical protein HanRHA438_Chr16g0748301 [Helianthus annuus]|nr:hypothetical protein HanRHA438_Chr16g0748301 [Helianthus annuus]